MKASSIPMTALLNDELCFKEKMVKILTQESMNQTQNLRVPFKGMTNDKAREGRLEFLNSIGKDLPSFENAFLKANQVKSNVESYIGTMSMPVGLVGPILFEKERGEFEQVFTNAATTEGALIASMNRGASIISRSGGFKAKVQKQTMLRSPLFCFNDLYEAEEFAAWLQNQVGTLDKYIKQFSKRAKLVRIRTNLLGRNVDCKFYYETGDAAGQNMTTICTWQACLWIEEHFNEMASFDIKEFVLEGNGASDKKVSHNSIVNGRGIDVVAECIIDEDLIQNKLKTSSKALVRFFNRSYQLTSIDGMIGNNINVTNTLASIFAVTGQDIACVHESGVGYLQLEEHKRGLYMSLKLPRLVVGTVGGGTSLPHQRESLELMGCYGQGKVERFAKLIAGFALGLELSTMSAMVSHQFAIAHERLGRNRPVEFLKFKELNQSFFEEKILIEKEQNVEFLTHLTESNGIITQLSTDKTEKHLGLSLWNVKSKEEKAKRELALLKSKTTDKETLNFMYILTGMIDPRLAKSFGSYNPRSEFVDSHRKENAIFEHLQKKNSKHSPKLYGTLQDDEREISLILMEFLDDSKMEIINSELTPDKWNNHHLKSLITGLNDLHRDLKDMDTEAAGVRFQSYEDFKSYSKHALEVLNVEYGKKYTDLLKIIQNSKKYLEQEKEILKDLPINVCHNDFNPRNVGMAKDGNAKVYDWELASLDVPMRDMMEMLLFIAESKNIDLTLEEIIKTHLHNYNVTNNSEYTLEAWKKGYQYAFAKFLNTRFLMYLLGNKMSPYPFLKVLAPTVIKVAKSNLFS